MYIYIYIYVYIYIYMCIYIYIYTHIPCSSLKLHHSESHRARLGCLRAAARNKLDNYPGVVSRCLNAYQGGRLRASSSEARQHATRQSMAE